MHTIQQIQGHKFLENVYLRYWGNDLK